MKRQTINGHRIRLYCACDYPGVPFKDVYQLRYAKNGLPVGNGVKKCKICLQHPWTYSDYRVVYPQAKTIEHY